MSVTVLFLPANLRVRSLASARSYLARATAPESRVVKKVVLMRAETWREARHAAAEQNTTVSALVAEALEELLTIRRGLDAVRAWEHEHGALTAAELAEAEAVLAEANTGMPSLRASTPA